MDEPPQCFPYVGAYGYSDHVTTHHMISVSIALTTSVARPGWGGRTSLVCPRAQETLVTPLKVAWTNVLIRNSINFYTICMHKSEIVPWRMTTCWVTTLSYPVTVRQQFLQSHTNTVWTVSYRLSNDIRWYSDSHIKDVHQSVCPSVTLCTVLYQNKAIASWFLHPRRAGTL